MSNYKAKSRFFFLCIEDGLIVGVQNTRDIDVFQSQALLLTSLVIIVADMLVLT